MVVDLPVTSGVVGGGGALIWWRSRRRIRTPADRFSDLAMVAADLECGGASAYRNMVSELRRTEEHLTTWMVHWRAAMAGPRGVL